ncbi:MAG: hypothetical protein N2321_02810 [Melioribacteraceae bacterium]|nr:hypothetical protein [Melioribacteraceae bacterium]
MELIELVLKSDIKTLENLSTETLIEVFKKLDYSNAVQKTYILEILKILFKRQHMDLLNYHNNNYKY